MRIYLCIFLYCALLYGKARGENESSAQIVSDLISSHIEKVDDYLQEYKLEMAKVYLDSISFYEKSGELTDPSILGYYYVYCGIYYSYRQKDVESLQCYYKAIDCYEEAGDLEQLIPLYHNIAFSYIQTCDTEGLKIIIDKMRSIALKQNEARNIANTYRVISFYYNCLFEKDRNKTIYLDSASFYDLLVIDIFNSHKDIALRGEDIAYNYVDLVSNSLRNKEFDMDTLTIYLAIADSLLSPNDTIMMINRLWIDGEMAYHKGNYSLAEQTFTKQLALMDGWMPKKEVSMYLDVYDRLAELSEMQADYRAAFRYQQKKEECLTQIHDRQKYEIVRELETKYEVQQKEQAINHLTRENDFQRRINYLYLGLILSGVTALLFLGRWLRLKRKAADTQLKLVSMERHDAMLQVRLQEEQLKQAGFEKYEALLDSHFKGEQISEMDEELKALREEQTQLNARISDYDEKVKEYEKRKSQEREFATYDAYNTALVRDVYELVNKRLSTTRERDEYLDRLKKTDDRFFSELKAKASEELSPLNIKYCLCFYLDMKTEYIAECFSVEPRSVHITRHRLKAKLMIDRV